MSRHRECQDCWNHGEERGLEDGRAGEGPYVVLDDDHAGSWSRGYVAGYRRGRAQRTGASQ